MTREPADRARTDARRAAQAVRLARRTKNAPPPDAAPVAPEVDADDASAVAVPVTTKPSLAKAPAVVDPEIVDPADEGDDDTAEADDATADDATAVPVEADADEADDTADKDAADAADDDEDDAKDDDGDDEGTARRVRRRPRRSTALASVAALLAAVFVVIAAVVHANAADTRSTSPAAARDAALLAARQDIVVLSTLDYRDVDAGLARWAEATTGTLHDQLTSISDADKQVIVASKSVTTASVLAAAVTQVDASRGVATVITSVQLVVTPSTGKATTKRNRLSLTMAKVGDVWKISAYQQIGVQVT